MSLPLHAENVAAREIGHRDLLKHFPVPYFIPNGTFFDVRPISRPLILSLFNLAESYRFIHSHSLLLRTPPRYPLGSPLDPLMSKDDPQWSLALTDLQRWMTADEADLWLVHSLGEGPAETAARLYSLTEAVWRDPLNDLTGFGNAFVFDPNDCRYDSAEAMLFTSLTELCCRHITPTVKIASDDSLKCLDICRSPRMEDLYATFVDIVTETLANERAHRRKTTCVVVLGNLDGTIRNGSWLFRTLLETITDCGLNLKVVVTSADPESLTSQLGPVRISRPAWASSSAAPPSSEKHSAAKEEEEMSGQQDNRTEEEQSVRSSPTPVLKDVLALVQGQPQLHSCIDTLILLGQSCAEDAKLWRLVTNWLKLGRLQPPEEGKLSAFLSQLVPATTEKVFQSVLASVSSPTQPWLTRALGRVLFTFRPLTLSEFSDLDDLEQPEGTVEKEIVKRDGQGVLMVQRQEVRLAHPGLRKYLETSRDGALGGWFQLPPEPAIHKHLAESCLNYLTCTSTHRLRELRTSESGSWHTPFERRDNLLSYAVKYWLRHAMLAAKEQVFETDACKRFMADEEALRQWAVLYRALSPTLASQQSDTTPPADALSSLVIFAEHGAQDLLAWTMQKHQKLGTPGFETACFAALVAVVGQGNIRMAKDTRLMESPPPEGETLDQLMLAALESDDATTFAEIFGMARQYPEKIRDTDNLIARAASLGRTAAVKDLLGTLKHSKATPVDTSDRLSALSYACQRGFVDVVDLLIREGGPGVLAELRQDGSHGTTPMPIKLAVKLGRLDIFSSLVASTIPQRPWDSEAVAFYCCVFRESQRYGRRKPVQSALADIRRRLRLQSDGSADDMSPGPTEGEDEADVVDYLAKYIIGREEYGEAVKDAIGIRKLPYDLLDLLTRAKDRLGEDEFAIVFRNWMEEAVSGNVLRVVKLVFENGAKSPWATTEALKSAATRAFRVALDQGDNGVFCMPYLIDKGADITSKGADLRTPLFAAAYSGWDKVVETLIAAQVDVNAKGDDEWYPLHACYDNAAITRMLVTNHADVNKLTEDDSAWPALAFAVRWEGSDAIDELLKGNSSRQTLEAGLQEAFKLSNPEMAEKLLPHCPDASYLRDMDSGLFYSHVWWSNGQLVERLLNYPYRIDPNKKNPNGRTALHHISEDTSVDIIKMLVTCGADIEAIGNDGETPLSEAVYLSNREAVRYLVEECGALITNGSTRYGGLLQTACRHSTLDIVKLLYNTKEGPTELNRIERDVAGTPLQAALRREESDDKQAIVRFLVEETEADVNLVSPFWGSALNLACLTSTPEIMRLLLGHGAVLDVKDHVDRTPLHFALFRTREHVELLLDKGANLDAVDVLDRNALHLAVLSGRLDLVRFVLSERPGFVVGRT